ncbi:hypothetical protein [Pedobacter sp. Leaf170]|uniref:hypothetical protein n=1 Tax=Pedobacter sp. Leaf170 TaxID=2876558 RepID=UPI001E475697|nr:hypothetical protein [Pedobacter sp. Leaf170]
MNSEDLKVILNNPLINTSAFAAKMFPTNTPASAKTRLHNKLKENVAGSGKQRLTDEDIAAANKILKELVSEINVKTNES